MLLRKMIKTLLEHLSHLFWMHVLYLINYVIINKVKHFFFLLILLIFIILIKTRYIGTNNCIQIKFVIDLFQNMY